MVVQFTQLYAIRPGLPLILQQIVNAFIAYTATQHRSPQRAHFIENVAKPRECLMSTAARFLGEKMNPSLRSLKGNSYLCI